MIGIGCFEVELVGLYNWRRPGYSLKVERRFAFTRKTANITIAQIFLTRNSLPIKLCAIENRSSTTLVTHVKAKGSVNDLKLRMISSLQHVLPSTG